MTTRLWLAFAIFCLLLMAHITLRMVYRRWAIKRCLQVGHDWKETETGFRCQRCPAGRNFGDRM